MSTFDSKIDPDFFRDQSCALKNAPDIAGQKIKRSHGGPVLAKNLFFVISKLGGPLPTPAGAFFFQKNDTPF